MKSGCGWLLAILGLGFLMLLAGVVSTAPGQGREPVNVGRATPAPRAKTVTIQTVHGPKEKPVTLIGAWFATGLLTLFAAAQVTRSAPAAKAVGIPGTGCGEVLAIIAVGIVTIVFFLAGALATLGGS